MFSYCQCPDDLISNCMESWYFYCGQQYENHVFYDGQEQKCYLSDEDTEELTLSNDVCNCLELNDRLIYNYIDNDYDLEQEFDVNCCDYQGDNSIACEKIPVNDTITAITTTILGNEDVTYTENDHTTMNNIITSLVLLFVIIIVVGGIGWLINDRQKRKENQGVVLKGTKVDQDDNQMDDGMMDTEEQPTSPQAMTELINVDE